MDLRRFALSVRILHYLMSCFSGCSDAHPAWNRSKPAWNRSKPLFPFNVQEWGYRTVNLGHTAGHTWGIPSAVCMGEILGTCLNLKPVTPDFY